MDLPKDILSCHSLILAQQKRIEVLEQQVLIIPQLIKRIEELETQIKQNSQNSHRPPSSDIYNKKPAFKRPKGKKRGGQQGHQGNTLEMVDVADHYVPHQLEQCTCGQNLEEVPQYVKERRQVFDIPQPRLEVTEHIVFSCTCPNCKEEVFSVFPDGVRSRVQYGNKINEGTQITAQQKCYELLEPSEQVIKEKLMESPVNHFDETGVRVESKNSWLHSCSNALYTYLFVHTKRGKKAINSAYSLLPKYKGWAIHDCWRSYFLFDLCLHAVGGAHILRELQALIEKHRTWAERMRALLLYAYYQSKKGTSKVKDFNLISNQYDRICQMADQEEPTPEYRFKGKKPKQTKGRNLLNRLVNHKEAVLAFAKYDIVPFTNNQAESDVRPAKIKLKIAGSFRTFNGAQKYARIQSFISTTRKNQLNVFNELLATFNGYNFLTTPEGAK